MEIDLAITLSCDWPSCVVRRTGTPTTSQARLSEVMIKYWIRVRPGDLLLADFDEGPPEVLYRWWRATVVAITGKTLSVAPMPANDDLTEPGFAWVLRGLDLKPKVGDSVFLMTGEAGEGLVVDIESGGEPAHPERFVEQYPRIRALIERG